MQMVQALQAGQQALQQEVSNLRAENQGLRQIRDEGFAAVPQMLLSMQQQTAAIQEQTQNLRAQAQQRNRSLVDNRGLGKPSVHCSIEK